MKLKGISTPYLDPLEISDDFYNEWKLTLVLSPLPLWNGNFHSTSIFSTLMFDGYPELAGPITGGRRVVGEV